ncbi:hypothetical protein FJ940_20015 [Mesorhizobium sp. B2-3-7]|nr:hypothetical protein FJ939_18430 [Mesorhizobium sp. B2-3-8]TPM12784.1 hypothetical protein FJ940_20015 [Mesorhizobium sp. B2-3-7]
MYSIVNETAAEGTAAEGTAAEGTAAEGTAAEGTAAGGTAAVGTALRTAVEDKEGLGVASVERQIAREALLAAM